MSGIFMRRSRIFKNNASVLEHRLHFATVLSRWASVARSVPSKVQQNHIIFSYKNTLAMRAAKIIKNNEGVFLRQSLSIGCQSLSNS